MHRLPTPREGRGPRCIRSTLRHPPARPLRDSGSAQGFAAGQAPHLPPSTRAGSSTSTHQPTAACRGEATGRPAFTLPTGRRSLTFHGNFPSLFCGSALSPAPVLLPSNIAPPHTPELPLFCGTAEHIRTKSVLSHPHRKGRSPLSPESYHLINRQLCSALQPFVPSATLQASISPEARRHPDPRGCVKLKQREAAS